MVLEDFRRARIKYPSLKIQDRIVAVLRAYDDLIENNTRRIKILEEMAKLIYREWFVEFKAPGVKLRKATAEQKKLTGKDVFPEGWEVKQVKEICGEITYGFTASASRENNGPKFLRITDIVPSIIDWDLVPYCAINERDKQKYGVREGDIVVARTGATTGYAKRLNKRHPETVFASYLVRFRTAEKHLSRMLGIAMESNDYKRFIHTNLGGAAQPQANAQVLGSYRIVLPTLEVRKQIDQSLEDLFDLKETLQLENSNLRLTRHLLLPKLVSGEVSV